MPMLRKLRRCETGLAALEFALLAPALLTLVFAIIIFALYFSAYMGVRQAASEGARAALAGLYEAERKDLARTRAQQVIDNYGSLLAAGGQTAQVDTIPNGETLEVRVRYDMSGSAIMRYAQFVPLPSPVITSSVIVTNGSY